jgi:PAS domain-containing protein
MSSLYSSVLKTSKHRKTEMNVNIFSQQIEEIHLRLADLYEGAIALEPLRQTDLLPTAFKELGIASEELQVAVETLRQQNEELAGVHQELEAERQRYQELFEFAPQAYLITDVEGTIREANRACCGAAQRVSRVSGRQTPDCFHHSTRAPRLPPSTQPTVRTAASA